VRNALQEIVDEFAGTPASMRLPLLLDFAKGLPPVPEELRDAGALERVHECQTPFFVTTRVGDGHVALHFDAPPEAPTTRGFAGVLRPEEILEVPSDFFVGMGLAELISPLRLRGMGAILATIKRQVVAQGGAG
jgi:cysteine desulfuration protein SufE